MTPARRANLARLLSPRHIAFVGGRDCAVAIREAQRIGFHGAIWPVNPGRAEIGGYPCFAAVADLPEAPDAVFLAVPAAAAVKVTAELAARGAGGIVCYTAGFREAGAEEAALETALIKAAGDLALIGPNCYGMINYLDRAALWPFAHGGTSPGYGAAIITQSGMLSSDITMSQRALPLTHMISCGNQSVLSLEDFADHLIDDPAVRTIGLHIEGLRDAPHFTEVALRAVRLGKPIVALKTGSSQIGSALTVSHTGSLSGADDLYDALFARVGVIRVRSPAELLETLKFVCIAGIPNGDRVAGFTCSGGGATMLADHAERIGMHFPPIAPQAKPGLEALLPPIATVSNPLDYTTPIWGDAGRTGPVFAAAMAATAADAAILVQDYPAAGLDESRDYYLADARAFWLAARARAIPAVILATLPENLDATTRELLVAEGVAPLQGLTESLNAVQAAIVWGARCAEILADTPAKLLTPAALPPVKMLDEAQAKAFLAERGLPVPQGRRVAGARLGDAAKEIGYPVVLKMLGPKLAHKSDAGAVAVGIAGQAALATALTQMRAAVAAYDPRAVTDDFLVEQMAARPLAELLIGLRRDAQFGVALTLAAGGILTELMADAVTLLLPATPADIGKALCGLRTARLLTGYRGGKAADMAALVTVISQLCQLMTDRPDLAEIEINPAFVHSDGVTIVDALIHVFVP